MSLDNTTDSVFGAVRMGYAMIESGRLPQWREFLQDALGLHRVSADADLLVFRLDDHARRLIIRRGPAEDFIALGWEVTDPAAYALILSRLKAHTIGFEEGTCSEAALRGVQSFVRIRGPKDLAIELFTQPLLTSEPLNMLTSGFVTGPSGLGHVAITTRHADRMLRFWREIFDARTSDQIAQALGGVMLDFYFLRLNERHHSIAIAATRGVHLDPIRTRVQHLNLEAATREDLAAAYERCRKLGYEMAHEIGQHPNDRELSFYVISPSGFEIEFGWDPLKVDEAHWKSGATYNAISVWGHRPPDPSALQSLRVNLGNLGRGLRSLLRTEYCPL